MLAILFLGTVRANAGSSMAGRPPAGEWIVAGGFGRAIRLGPTRSQESFLLLAPQWSVRMGRRVEWVIEGHLARYLDPDARLGGLLPIGGRIHTGIPLSPFLSLGAGFAWTDLALPEIDRRFNFILQGGIGLRWPRSRRGAGLLELRLVHVSNANTTGRNLGLNSLLLLAGWRVR